jgi:hypothetical protein
VPAGGAHRRRQLASRTIAARKGSNTANVNDMQAEVNRRLAASQEVQHEGVLAALIDGQLGTVRAVLLGPPVGHRAT